MIPDVRYGIRQRGIRGRPRRHEDNAARQKAYREERKLLQAVLADFRAELLNALSYGRRPKLLEHGPDEPTAWLVWATERLLAVRLVPYPRAPGEGKRLSTAATAVLTALLAGEAMTVDEGRVAIGGRAVQQQVWRMLCERGYVVDGRLTDAGREGLRKSQ